MTFRTRVRAYRDIGRIQFKTVLVYRTDFLIGAFVLLLQVFVLKVVWTSVYAGRTDVEGSAGVGQISLSVQIAYVTLAVVQAWILNARGPGTVVARVRDGKVAIDLSRPVGFVQQMLAGQVGGTLAIAPFGLLALPFAMLIGGAAPPGSLSAFAGYLLALTLGYILATLLGLSLAMVAFWTMEVTGIFMIYRLVNQFLSGMLVPLWFMPDWMRTVAELLPFQATTYTPVSIYLGVVHGPAAWRAIAIQGVWIIVLSLLLKLIWSRALHRVVVQGG